MGTSLTLPLIVIGGGLLLPLIVFGFIAVVLASAIRSGRRPPAPLDPAAPVLLQGHLTRADGSAPEGQSAYGTAGLDQAYFYWHPSSGQPWRTPIPTITVLSATTAAGPAAAHVDLLIDGSGTWRLEVSDRPITRFMGSDTTRFAQARRGAEFRDRLLAAGARPG
jgi:hypothetical protein